MKLTDKENDAVVGELEERADYITNDELRQSTATNDFFDQIQRKLLGRGTKLVVGPRGCGKTHMMRYAQLSCVDDASSPFAVYVSFNRYYRLEPMLQSQSNAIRLFQVWALANSLLAVHSAMVLFGADADGWLGSTRFTVEQLEQLVSRLETGGGLGSDMQDIVERLTVVNVGRMTEKATERAGRLRCILLFDDAALTLTPSYLIEFFDIVRTIKTATISPKASVYPGTDYGPRFHAHHEAEDVPAWLAPDGPRYETMMDEIARKRFSAIKTISIDVVDQLKFAAFGVPRGYLALMRRFVEVAGSASTQSALNTVIDEHVIARVQEFNSLAQKVPQFESLVAVGLAFFNKVVEILRVANLAVDEGDQKQLIFGLSDDQKTPLRDRMLSLLLEAGLLYEHPKVSHGEDRTYRRFTPHLGSLMQQRAFSGKTRGVSPKRVVEFLRRPSAKHPVRRALHTVLSPDEANAIRLSLPPCEKCKTVRMSENQRFCHQCGSELLAASTFASYLQFPLDDVPGLTAWQKERIRRDTSLRTIGDLLSYQDPGSELRKIQWVGQRRASSIIDLVYAHVDEFFS